MLPEQTSLNYLQGGHQLLVAIHTEMPQITRTKMFPENSPFNDLEDQKLPWIIADSIPPKEAMLTERSPFDDLEVAYQMILVAIHPETPQINRIDAS